MIRRVERRWARALLATILVSWVLVPLAAGHLVSPDATAYVAAVRQADKDPDALYAGHVDDWGDVTPQYRRTWCDVAEGSTTPDCRATAFLSSPLALPVSWALSFGGRTIGVGVFQVLAAVALVASMVVMWRSLVDRARHAPAVLAGTALLLTPLAWKTVALGQTSPWLLLTVVLGVSARDVRRRGVSLAGWLGAVAFKSTPAALAGVLIWRRRFASLLVAVASIAVLFALSWTMVPLDVWSGYLTMTRRLAQTAGGIPHNSSVAALVAAIWGADAARTYATEVQFVSFGLFGAFCVATMRRVGDDVVWALAAAGLLLVTPLVWSHYLWVLVGACAVAIAARRGNLDRVLWCVPAVALAVSAPVSFGAETALGGVDIAVPLSERFWQFYRPLAFLASLGVLAVVVASNGRTGSDRPARQPRGISGERRAHRRRRRPSARQTRLRSGGGRG